MKFWSLRIGLTILAACCATPAMAVDVSSEFGLVSDYRYRGFSLSDGKPAAQALITFEYDSGAYASIWTSTIDEDEIDSNIELDLIGGYAFNLGHKLSLDLSATYYVYPSGSDSNYVEGTAVLERVIGPTALKAGFSFVPRQHGTLGDQGDHHRNSYIFAGASYEFTKLPLTLSAEFGHERGFFDEVEGGGKWDWSMAADFDLDPFQLGLSYSGTDAGSDGLVASLFVEL